MAYATSSDLAAMIPPDKLAQLTTGSGATSDSTIVTAALANASSLIDGYLAGVATVPVTDATTLAILKPHCIAIVKWQLFLRNDIGEGFGNSLKAEYDATVRWLEMIAKGDISLPTTVAVPSVTLDENNPTTGSDDPVFDLDNAGGL